MYPAFTKYLDKHDSFLNLFLGGLLGLWSGSFSTNIPFRSAL